jgi:hypothetical protein
VGLGEDIRKGCRKMNVVEIYGNGKMRPIETVPGTEGGENKEDRVNLTKIYCKHFCNCHSLSPVQQ